MNSAPCGFVARLLASMRLAMSPVVLKATLCAALLATTAGHARAQTLTPIPPPTAPRAAAPAQPQLPPPVTDSERRFRDLSAYIRTRGEIDATTRGDITRLAEALDADIAKTDAPASTTARLLAARAQAAIWLDDRAARNSAFERLAAMQPNKDAVLIAWGRELIADGQLDRALEMLGGHTFAPNREVDARILLASCLMGLNRYEDAITTINTAPQNRTPDQMAQAEFILARIGMLREMWNSEMSAMFKDQQRGDLPLVELVTPKGAITIELFEDQAPNTVGNFIEHVEAGTYTGTRFHRIVRGLGVQGGDPTTASGGGGGGTGSGGWTIPDETQSEAKRPAMLGRLVAVSQPNPASPNEAMQNSAGCQFMILLAHNEQLGKAQTVFGRVSDGLDVVRELTQDDSILSAQVIRKRNHDYRGVRLTNDAKGDFTIPRGVSVQSRSLETKVQGPTMTPRTPAPAQAAPVQLTPVPAPK